MVSTRYLWDVYNIEQKPVEKQELVTSSWETINTSLTYCAALAKDYEITGSGVFKLKDPLWVTNIFRRRIDEYKYMVIRSSDVDTADAIGSKMFYNKYQDSYSEPLMWGGDGSTGNPPYIQHNIIAVKESQYGQSGATHCNFAKCTIERIPSRGGTRTGVASSTNRNEYPDDGAANGSWYVYKGSDSIDPLSVTYNTDRPERGKPVTVAVEPAPISAETPQWNAAVLPASAVWSGIAYGGGWFVAVGGGGATHIARSSDGGKTWSSVSNSLYDADAVGYANGKFVAVGLNTAAYSTDNGATWTAAASFPNGQWHAVCYGGGKFVAVNSAADKAMYSSDGNVWTEISLPGGRGWLGIAYGNGRFVVTTAGMIAYSDNLTDWTTVGIRNGGDAWRDIAFADGKFVIVGDYGSAYSANAENWTLIQGLRNLDLQSVAYGGGKFMAVGVGVTNSATHGTTISVYSTDAASWETMTLPTNAEWMAVSYGDSGFAAVSMLSDAAAYLPDEVDLGYTVSYLYQYSTNGGTSWTAAGAATADTQIEITIPDEAEQFMARARAQDDIGFTSADYVAGANLAVQTMRLWVGVENVAKQGRKLWVGVDGAARPVVRGWVGDENGKARRWF